MIEKKRIQIRRDLEENWVNNNPILLYGEIGFDKTTNKIKIGDGERPWNELSWVNEVSIDLSIFYTKEEIDTILNELNTNLSNDYYTKEQTTTEIQNTIDSTLLSYYNKEQVDEIVSNIEIGGGGSVGTTNYNELENRPTTNIQGLTYEQGYELMEYINNNKELPYPLSLQGIYLNDCRLGTVEPNFIEINIDGLNSRQIRLWLNTDEQSFGVDYLDYISSTDVFDIRLIPLQKRDEFFNFLTTNLSIPENTTVVVGGIILNGLEISNPYEDNESIEIHFKYYTHPKSYDIRLIYLKENKFISYDFWEMENKELVTKEQVDELISNSGGSGESADLSNYFTKEETITEIQNAIEVIDLYTADGNTLHEFITYLKDNPTTKLTDKIVTYRGKVCENFEVGGNSVLFYHNAFCFSEDKKDTDVSFTVVLTPNPAMPQFIQKSYIPDATGVANVVPTTNQMNTLINNNVEDLNERIQELQDAIDGIETTDLSNYYTKEETNTEIQNAIDSIEIPTTDLSNYYNKQEIDNIVGLINNELEIIING